jgi:hypothetical protein
MHGCLPNFVIRLSGDDERHQILETKSFDPLDEVKRSAAERWVNAVNADATYGRWSYAIARKPEEVERLISAAVQCGEPSDYLLGPFTNWIIVTASSSGAERKSLARIVPATPSVPEKLSTRVSPTSLPKHNLTLNPARVNLAEIAPSSRWSFPCSARVSPAGRIIDTVASPFIVASSQLFTNISRKLPPPAQRNQRRRGVKGRCPEKGISLCGKIVLEDADMDIEAFGSAVALANHGLDLLRKATDLIPRSANKEAAIGAIEQAETMLCIAEAKAAGELGFPTCPCCWPPQVMTLTPGRQAWRCRACLHEHSPPRPQQHVLRSSWMSRLDQVRRA